jgi:hypothetical protein
VDGELRESTTVVGGITSVPWVCLAEYWSSFANAKIIKKGTS